MDGVGGANGGQGPPVSQYPYCTMRKHNPLPHLMGGNSGGGGAGGARNLTSSTAELIDCSGSDLGSRQGLSWLII